MGDEFLNRQKTAKEILDGPRVKSDPPRPPMGPQLTSSTDEALDSWGEHMEKWQKENSHLPNQQSPDKVVSMMKQRRDQMKNQQAGGARAQVGEQGGRVAHDAAARLRAVAADQAAELPAGGQQAARRRD